ncbi:MAG: SDR family oxidoreductase [Sphingobacteriales bacterium]|nr:SDR family oxidoreductase [Sphingobacteriales bacterium]MBI3719567.1 SDR family oxidoreductase [Sphingobacteriales bacterium]
MKKILITGTNGMLGKVLVKQLLEKGFYVIGTSRGECKIVCNSEKFKYYEVDITDYFQLHDVLFDERPEVVIHAAAMTQADECELNKDKCWNVNQHGTVHALVGAKMYSSFLIYVSTDFVFDGEKGMYKEEDECRPVNWYGHCKLAGESVIKDAEIPWSIVRTCLVYGEKTSGGRDNIITWADGKLSKHEKIKVVDDQVRTPTYIGDLAKGIISIIEKKATGIYHLSGKDVLTPYQMAKAVAKYKSYDESLIERVTADTFTQPAKRPAKTGFVIDKAINELGYDPISFAEGIKKVLG